MQFFSICFAIDLVFILSANICLCADAPIRNYDDRVKMFEYNPGDPLDIKYISRKKQDDAWVHDITFAGPMGDQVTAFLRPLRFCINSVQKIKTFRKKKHWNSIKQARFLKTLNGGTAGILLMERQPIKESSGFMKNWVPSYLFLNH